MKECFICGYCFGDHNEICNLDQSVLETTLSGVPLIKNRYRLDRRINTEIIGITYLAYDVEKKSKVFIKILLMDYLSVDIQLFFKEVEAAAQIEDLNILSVLSCGKKDNEFLYIVVEYVEGEFLSKFLEQSQNFSLEQIVSYITSLCRAVDLINANEQIIKDLKASNVLIDVNDGVKFLNVGLVDSVKLLDIKNNPNVFYEFPYYNSPEQCLEKDIDERSEVYSIGVILYAMLTGEFPFTGQNYFAVIEQHIRQTAKDPRILNPDIPDSVAAVVIRAIEKDPNKRFQTVLAFSSLLVQAFRQKNKTNLQKSSITKNPITEELPVKGMTPQELLSVRSSSYFATEEIDTNKTLEVSNLKSSQPLEIPVQNVNRSSSLVIGVKQSSNLTELTDKLKKVSEVKVVKESNFLNNEDKSREIFITGIEPANVSVSKISTVTDPLPINLQDGTKPLPPELQAMFGLAPSNPTSDSSLELPVLPLPPQAVVSSQLTSSQDIPAFIPSRQDFTSQEILDEVSRINESIKIASKSTESSFTLSPASVVYMFIDKFLSTSTRASQYKRKMHGDFVVEREALASLLLVLAIFSLRKRKSLKILSVKNTPPVLQKKLGLREDESLIFQLVNAGVKPLDQLEQSVLKSLGKPNAVSSYGLYRYFFEISDQQKISIAELINDAVADDMVKRKLLTIVPRDVKVPLEPGGSLNAYNSSGVDLNPYSSQCDEVKKFIDELKKETIIDVYSNQVQLYDYMLDYYKKMFCEHSFSFEQ